MRLSRLAFVSATVLLVAACSSGAAPAASQGSLSPAGDATVQTVEVKLSDALRIEPATMTFQAGKPIRFIVTNTGSTTHEFFVGDEEAQMDHDDDMAGMGAMTQDEMGGIGVMPGDTKTLDYTFSEPGTYQAGCHVNGHYAAGMKATITVTS